MSIYTTEITSDQIMSDNPLHQRLLKAYYLTSPFVRGNVLELGCGEGRGIDIITKKADSYLALDKIPEVINTLTKKFPDQEFKQALFPPMDLPDESFDTIISFQVIEHIKEDQLFLKEIARLLKVGGTALISTPNHKMTLSRNPWHVREYTGDKLAAICKRHFSKVEMQGIAGSDRVMKYHEKNRLSVQKIMKWDIFDLQHHLPKWVLQRPYEILNRKNRNKLQTDNEELVNIIGQEDYFLRQQNERSFDLFCMLQK